MSTQHDTEKHLLQLTQDLLDCIAEGDWDTYTMLCADDLTCFEPEAVGHLVEGLPFHKYYFDLPKAHALPGVPARTQITRQVISSPKVRFLGDSAAVVTYVRLQQRTPPSGVPVTVASEETRVWEKQPCGEWVHVHFHRSPCPGSQ